MADKLGHILAIVEGEDREYDVIDNIRNTFFSGKKPVFILTLSAKQNVYMLWNKLKNDDFETDLVEILKETDSDANRILSAYSRDDFDEIYLFFDFDGHHDNLKIEDRDKDVLSEMLQTFDNETELGKLYISYPMIEALRDYKSGTCNIVTECTLDFEQLTSYKHRSGTNNANTKISNYSIVEWKDILSSFSQRLSCLFKLDEVISYRNYKDSVTPYNIYLQECHYTEQNKIFVLSGIPEFLLDYYSEKFWINHIKNKKMHPLKCSK
ncbi:MAG: hypothetical protein K2G44_02330 [Clostridia bacterium]|nr:hypothetical protein [Clostridia bacterium]